MESIQFYLLRENVFTCSKVSGYEIDGSLVFGLPCVFLLLRQMWQSDFVVKFRSFRHSTKGEQIQLIGSVKLGNSKVSFELPKVVGVDISPVNKGQGKEILVTIAIV